MSDAEIREAGAPFDAPDADIILRSADGVHFKFHKQYLTRALYGFEHILGTGELNGIGAAEERQNGLTVIPLPESTPVLDLFLRVLFPVELGCPVIGDHLGHMPGVCKALSKYCVRNMPAGVRDGLLLASVQKPELVYAITCPYDSLSNVTKVAAKHTLRDARRLDDLPAEVVAEISGLQYHALTQYQIACRTAAIAACDFRKIRCFANETPGLSPTEDDPPKQCNCYTYHHTVVLRRFYGPPDDSDFNEETCELPGWLVEYCNDVAGEIRTGRKICGNVALNDKPLATAIRACKSCPACGTDVGTFFRFAHFLAEWIDQDISEVELESNTLAS
ncbi:unnamed protein product [Peniophora sp. CBMAI 1063]|nr:unnamed protein product [Peniophora sp. CBMAI 1063]